MRSIYAIGDCSSKRERAAVLLNRQPRYIGYPALGAERRPLPISEHLASRRVRSPRGHPVSRCVFALAIVALAARLGAFGLSNAADAQQPAPPRRIGVLLISFSPESKEAQAFTWRNLLGAAGCITPVVQWHWAR